jgi:hypothetical protein
VRRAPCFNDVRIGVDRPCSSAAASASG